MRPLEGVRVVELAALGPLEHAGMLLADLGASVLRVHRPGAPGDPRNPILRGRRHLELDLKTEDGRACLLDEVRDADVLLEGFRPGVMERLRLGPHDLAEVAPGLVYGRMTGWGQSGPRAARAGHDINYTAETGALWATRTDGARPTAALNLVGDNGGGSLYLVVGVLAALLERRRTARGAVIDAAIVDGVSSLLQTVRGLQTEGRWGQEPAANLFDSGAPFYDTYRCADGEYMAVGAIEPQFYDAFVRGLGLDPAGLPDRADRTTWPTLRARFAEMFAAHTRAHWARVFAPLDACVSPVWSLAEAGHSDHLVSRRTLLPDSTGGWSAAPAPRIHPLPAPDDSRAPERTHANS
ncbi:CaiB/BaiF CoA-transferase family protein [Georgenia sp. H159]|uniref:CaiB/BaiF CoA transferase family protein n=1 Tax=Georgenia sp. H159 TaxID=3076115 RepID=UPI002D7A11D8|nr:CaiB/BaiF CoA-transferase family protein [Georgenia sp. H159]